MAFNLSSWAIRRPIPTIVLFFVLTVTGIFSFQRLPVNANPNVSFPIVSVTVTQAGASPDELEHSVTRRIEDAVAGMAKIRHITSTVIENSSVTTIEFALEVDTDRAVNDVRNAISQIRGDLPQNIDNPIVERVDIEGGALAYYAVEAPNMSPAELSWFIDDSVSRHLLSVPGVQQVKRFGGEKREIRVTLQPDRLTALGITAEQVNTQLTQTNVNVPAGRVVLDGWEQTLRVVNSAETMDRLEQTIISLSNGRRVKLRELATISDTNSEIRHRARLNGREIIGFNVFRSKGSSDTVVSNDIRRALKNLQVERSDVRISEIHSSVDATEESYHVAINTLIEGAILTVLVVMLFLRNWRATLVATIALPLSILPAFTIMYLFDYTLNSVTLLALTLVVGILVDDAIVEIENIEQHLQQGKRPFFAAIDAADAIGFAVVAITAAIVAIFLPVSFIKGAVGQYFTQFGITVSVAVLSSLLVARLVTPLLSAYLLQPRHNEYSSGDGRVLRSYLSLLQKSLYYRKTALFVGGILLIGSLMLIPLLPTGFMPKGDIGVSQMNITLPPGSTLAQTDKTLQKITALIRRYSEVHLVFSEAGGNGEVAKGHLLIRLKPQNERDISQKEFEDMLRKDLSQVTDIRFAFQNESAQRDVSIILTSSNPKILAETASQLKVQMQRIQGISNVQVNSPLLKSQLQIRLRADEAARAGVSAQTIGDLLRIATVGDIDASSARFNFPGRQVPVRVMLPEWERDDLETLKRLHIASDNGGTVPLYTVADLFFSQGEASLERFDRERRVSVEADLMAGNTVGDVLTAIKNLPILQNLPNNVRMPEYGDAEYMNEMFEQFGTAMALGILAVFTILILLFRDFLQPITILITLPLSISGAVGGLLAYGAALDLSSVIGILMLMGIVTKNAILLVDFVIEKRRQGEERMCALLESGRERARPIIMTTVAMVAGMLPAVFAGGSGAAFRAPMAVAVICGLITSTLLSLVFVPVVYSLMDDLQAYIAPKLARLTSVTTEDRAKAER